MSKRPISLEDLNRLELVSNPVLSPDAERIIFERTVPDVKEDGYQTHLFVADRSGRSPRPLTHGGTSNHGAQWSPDGRKVAFVSNRSMGSQLWLLPMDGGEARQLTRFRHGVGSPRWSPDGKTLYGLASLEEGSEGESITFPEDMTEKEFKERVEKEDKEWEENPKRFRRLYYRDDGDGFRRFRCRQLVAIDVETGLYRVLTEGAYHVGSIAVSPDGRYVAFVSNRRVHADVEWWWSDLYRVSTEGGDMELLSDAIAAHQIKYSPDGRHLAVIGHGRELFTYWSAAHEHLFILSASGAPEPVQITEQFPDTLGDTNLSDVRGNVQDPSPVWSQDGRFIYTLSTREGRSEIVRFDVSALTGTGSSTAAPRQADAAKSEAPSHLDFPADVVIGGDRDIHSFDFDGSARFVFGYATPTLPSVISEVCVDGQGENVKRRAPRALAEPMQEETVPFFPAGEVRVDDSNRAFFDEVALVEPEPFWYTSRDGWRVQGWVMRPAGFEEGRKYPVILEIHGGPQLNYGYAMFHEMQWFAAQGYAIVLTNPRGGMSYGQEFANGVRHHYGEGDANDVMDGLAAALQQFSFLDGDRAAVTGGSYGGFMTNWLVGHTDRFFAAVSQRSISNWISF